MSKIDVIMPTYNQWEFLYGAIAHILAQTFGDFTFIIVNDGSVDKTSDILREYEQIKRIKIVTNKRNKGLPASLNIGHAAGDSPYCTWISTDNNEYPVFLEQLYKTITEGGYDFVQGCYIVKSQTCTFSYNKPWENKSNWGYGCL